MTPQSTPARLSLVGSPPPAASALGRAIKLSILMPVFNEESTVAIAVARVLTTPLPCDFELIVVDDGSTDQTPTILAALAHPRARVVTHARNRGKGAALRTAAATATGTHLVPFDADLEYDPADLVAVVEPIIQGRSDVVYGTRLFGANTRYQSYRQATGNRVLTLAANLMFDAYVSDIHTCVKVVPSALFRELGLQESGFGLDTEITAKLLRRGIRPFEVPVSYHSRSVAHGKKITWRDGVECLQVLMRVRMIDAKRIADAGRTVDLQAEIVDEVAAALALLAGMDAAAAASPGVVSPGVERAPSHRFVAAELELETAG